VVVALHDTTSEAPHEADDRDLEHHVIVDCIGAVAASALQNNNVI
jgi:hypothetical protein